MKLPGWLLAAALLALPCGGGCATVRQHWAERFAVARQKIGADYDHYYSQDTVVPLAAAFGAGAAVANSDADEELHRWWQEDVRSSGTDKAARVAKGFGEGYYVAAAAGAGLLLGEVCPETPLGDTIGRWGRRTARALAVGGPPMLAAQVATGASRPGESSAESDWVPMADNNGVSGHSFVGAVSFISAAQMSDDPLLKAAFYAASTAPALSRINDDAHYTSQAFLGWWMAYLACRSVDATEREDRQMELMPLPMPDGGFGVGVAWER